MEIVVTANGRLVTGAIMPALCLDLDGTVRYSTKGEFINSPEEVAVFPDVEAVLRDYRARGYLVLGVSNQGGVAYGLKTPESNDAELDAMIDQFKGGNPFHFIKCCFHHPKGTVAPWNIRSLLRKPDIGMLALMESELFDEGYIVDWDNSLFVGDRPEDKECAENAGIAFQFADDFFGRKG